MSAYNTIDDLLDLKHRMDMANIADVDRAVVLDDSIYWQNALAGLTFRTESPTPRPATLFGFRIVWRKRVVTTKETYSV